MVIGITGGSGSGKSVISGIFSEYGFVVIDADKIAKQIMAEDENLKKEISDAFGSEFILENGSVDRKKLGKYIFANPEKIETLNRLTHPKIIEKIIQESKLSGEKAVIDVPLLFDSPLEKVCDVIIGVIADNEIRVKRIAKRDGIDDITAKNRIAAQLSNGEIAKRSDYVIKNNGKIDDLREEVKLIIERLCK